MRGRAAAAALAAVVVLVCFPRTVAASIPRIIHVRPPTRRRACRALSARRPRARLAGVRTFARLEAGVGAAASAGCSAGGRQWQRTRTLQPDPPLLNSPLNPLPCHLKSNLIPWATYSASTQGECR